MNLLVWLEEKFSFQNRPQKQNLGALIDTRTLDERAKDYHVKEVVASVASVDWKEIEPALVRNFGVQNQNQKSDCVAESRRKLNRIIFKVNRGLDLDFSAVELYRRRVNYPSPGMQAVDVMSLCRNGGMTLNVLEPSEPLDTEEKANAVVLKPHNADIGKVFSIHNEVIFTPGDMVTPAGTIQVSRKGIMTWYFFTADEWSKQVPTINKPLSLYSADALHHSVVAVEPALYNGQKGWWIEDSAHFGGISRRFITEDFHKARNTWASYPVNFKFEVGETLRPRYDDSTRSLQECLRYEGLFPTNVDLTGFYGPITTQAVKDFQKKYGFEQIGTVGPLTRTKLKTLYP